MSSSPIDQQLARYGARDVTVLLCRGLLRAMPHAEPLPVAQSMAQLVERLLGRPGASRCLIQDAAHGNVCGHGDV